MIKDILYTTKNNKTITITHESHLIQGNRRVALCTVVGILEDGETYSTELKQRQSPGAGKMAQWEHELVCRRW